MATFLGSQKYKEKIGENKDEEFENLDIKMDTKKKAEPLIYPI